MAAELFNWNLTEQAASGRVETRRTHPLNKGGLVYGQRYNVNKDLFNTASKYDHGLFGEPHLEGMTCPPSLLDAWATAARKDRNAGLAVSLQSRPRVKRLRKAFDAMKRRIDHALRSSMQTSFGAREEYRISWLLFTDLDPPTAGQCTSHQPFWVVSTADVNEFMRWEFNRWISAIDFLRTRGSNRVYSWENHQRNMVMVTILLRSLKASVNCHHVAKRSQMFKDAYKDKKGKPLQGLAFQYSMLDSGLAWLPRDLFNWGDLHLHDELLLSTTFSFNGLRGAFMNWKDVNTIHEEYEKARDLEKCLQDCSDPEKPVDILDRMRKMIYRHLALQVIQQLQESVENRETHETIRQGWHGLSFDNVYRLTDVEPRLTEQPGAKSVYGRTYPARVQKLFDWDDGIARTFWDHCFYRQLARSFYSSIAACMTAAEADG